ncbi:uncharacterized protein LOC121619628 isoform X2 [Chelmon rostratus]|uniref:uncharacterized protein LOC121619628 isoform X2 n=1 Tax=Chelmon rostratus TaxID=109905 RepID=UPI001BEA62B8|nr:uncharacterized protein LOC121619628 isoform X2 [Chelmon rostratus]
MSNSRHQRFRSFLTERFTTVAVEIFEEVETIVEAYYEENKRLRNILHVVLNPEIKLPRIDVSQYTGAPTDGSEQPPELNTRVVQQISEPLPKKKPKEEQIEYDINWGSEQQQGLEEAHNSVTTDCVKRDPEEDDSNTPCIADSYHIEVVDWKQDSSGTVSLDETDNEDKDWSYSNSEAVSDSSQLFSSTESTSGSPESQEDRTSTKKTSKCSLQRTMVELPRMKSFVAAPADCQSFVARITEIFKDDVENPLITNMDLTADENFVECAFGRVPKGCPLSYQCPLPSSQDYKPHINAPPRPQLPLPHHTLKATSDFPPLSAKAQEHVQVMQITWKEANCLEYSTRGQEELVQDLQKLRLTSRFREICKLKPGRSHVEHLLFKIQKGLPKSKSAQIDKETKTEALRVYCKNLCVNWYPCGFIVHPNVPWLGVMPDGLVYDPNENPSFGLVHVKCVRFQNFIDCGFLVCREGGLQLKKTHSYYWHIQAEMMVAGTSWCDLLVFSREDLLVQRLYRDKVLINIMRKKLNDFFFHHFLPSLV